MISGEAPRCGFVALLGAPNAGKSTLLNAMVGAKVAIVTPKRQTTRTRILGICAVGGAQLVLVDTPGVFLPRRRLDRAMVAAAWREASEADAVAVLVDAKAGVGVESRRILDRLERDGRRAACVLNKIDLVRRDRLLPLVDELRRRPSLTDFFMISAARGDGVGELKAAMAGRMPPGPWLMPEDQLSDMNERLFAAEVTREKLFLALREELPYALAVETESWESFADGSVRIGQVVYVERERHKGIVLGKGGRSIRSIRERSRDELRDVLGREVHLFLFVKVRDWSEDPERYRDWGLEFSPRD